MDTVQTAKLLDTQNLFRMLIACICLAGLCTAAHAATPISLRITKVKCFDPCRNEGLEAAGESAPDFYAKVWINGVETTTPRGDEDQEEIAPGWTLPANLPPLQLTFPVTIQIWDHDSTSGDDLGDATPPSGKNNLDFTVDAVTGQWTGDVNWPEKCVHGGNPGGEPAVEVCFEILGFEDSDGDGLLDDWERNGYDPDRDNIVDVNFPAFGANAQHKDLFVEIDWMAGVAPTRQTIQAWKAAFAAAPIDAGRIDDPAIMPPKFTHISNPDGLPGINLWVDTGALTDASGALVGDNLGGGNQVATVNVSGLSPAFYAIKNNPANFDRRRLRVFRYGLMASDPTNNTGTSSGSNTLSTLNDNSQNWQVNEWARRTLTITGGTGAGQASTVVSNTARRLVLAPALTTAPDNTSTYTIGLVGGDGEVGGNDFVEFNHDPGTLMHELGHNLNLQHGGGDGTNCKPNYVSVMNYDLQFGIPQNAGSGQGQDFDGNGTLEILDYSPPRFPGGRGAAPLQTLVESSLPEGVVLDNTDAANQLVFVRTGAGKIPWALNAGIDWAGDGAPPLTAPMNVNTVGLNGRPPACRNTLMGESLDGFHDWNFISLNQRLFADANGTAINPVRDQEPTLEDRRLQQEELNTTDLELTKTAAADVPVAGQEIVYRFKVRNNGPRAARIARLIDPLSPTLSLLSASAGCSVDTTHTMTCELGLLKVGEQRDLEARFHIAADLPCKKEEQFYALENRARVLNAPGPDSNPRNNESMVTTAILCVRFEYAAKLVCGKQGEPQSLALAPAQYATTVNIHNPNDEKVSFFKKLALTEAGQRPGRVIPVAIDNLSYDFALRLDCDDLRRRLGRSFPYTSLLEGFAVIQSPRSLDVTGVYTTSAIRCTTSERPDYHEGNGNPDRTDGKNTARTVRTCNTTGGTGDIHVEQIRERRRDFDPVPAPQPGPNHSGGGFDTVHAAGGR